MNANLQKSLDELMKPYGEKQLQLYREKVIQSGNNLINKRDKISKSQHNFKLQLITISGGTLSIFVALQSDKIIDIFTKLGFAGLGLSLLFGIMSLFLGLESAQSMIQLEEENNIKFQELELGFIEKFGKVNVELEKNMQKSNMDINTIYHDQIKGRENLINHILKLLHVNGQLIEDSQFVIFGSGILLIVIGLFI